MDKVESIENHNHNILIPHVKTAPSYRQKKFAIFGTKISDSMTGSSDFINYESNERLEKILEEQSPKATEILGRILQNNLNTYNQLINYNYKTKVKNHDDEIKNNRLNFLLGMRRNEKVFSIRPASLNDLNERLGKIYTVKNYTSTKETSTQTQSQSPTKIIYDLSKKQNNQSQSALRRSQLNSASAESFKKLPEFPEVLKKLALVDFHDKLNQD